MRTVAFVAWGLVPTALLSGACNSTNNTPSPWQELGGSTPTTTTSSSTSSTTSSTHTGATGGTGGYGASGGAGATGATGGTGGQGGTPACADTGSGEPGNNTETGAFVLGPLDDHDPNPLPAAAGVIRGKDDQDWYTYAGNDTFLYTVDPWVGFAQDVGVRICMFFECGEGTTTVGGGSEIGGSDPVVCPGGTAPVASSQGRIGCCADPGVSAFTLDLACTGTSNDSAQVYLRLDVPNATDDTCIAYSLRYHY